MRLLAKDPVDIIFNVWNINVVTAYKMLLLIYIFCLCHRYQYLLLHVVTKIFNNFYSNQHLAFADILDVFKIIHLNNLFVVVVLIFNS